jgi:hypothetical protein
VSLFLRLKGPCHHPLWGEEENNLGLHYQSIIYAKNVFQKSKHIQKTKIDTKEHINLQNINICIRNIDTKKEG